jgi:sigma-B regulation protein RsbU (phosphoserine phosphatase)
MRFAAGGHPPAIMVLPDGTTEVLAAKGPVIGACEGMKFPPQEIGIPAGARLFVFSDGAYEIQKRDGTMMAHDDLRELLARAPREGGVVWVMDRLREINPHPVFDDDVSLVELSFS